MKSLRGVLAGLYNKFWGYVNEFSLAWDLVPLESLQQFDDPEYRLLQNMHHTSAFLPKGGKMTIKDWGNIFYAETPSVA